MKQMKQCLNVVVLAFLMSAGSVRAQSGDPAFSVASVLTHQEALDRPHDVQLQGNLAFVPGKGGSLAIVDVSDPKSPEIVWHRRDPQKLEDAETVLLFGAGRLFLGTDDLHSIDVSNPRKPIFQARISDRKRIARINGMVRRDRWIFAASKHGWLDAFDVGDPERPGTANAGWCC